MNIYTIIFYIILIRPLLSLIKVPPIEFNYEIQIEEIIQRGKKRNILVYHSMSWIDIFKMIFIFIFYPIKINTIEL